MLEQKCIARWSACAREFAPLEMIESPEIDAIKIRGFEERQEVPLRLCRRYGGWCTPCRPRKDGGMGLGCRVSSSQPWKSG
jgi:hypothetical protein